ncbi:MAG: hypothetical protein LBP99_00770 [Azoarcus sp.]|nr:hypothetical protein [Azoarcus sp.]
MRIAAAFSLMLMICGGCTMADPPLSGEPDAYTHISPAVRQDILKTARKLFKAATGCKHITQIDITVQNIRMMFSKKILNGETLHPLPSGGFLLDDQEIPPEGYVQENDEFWQVTGCKTRRDFTVKIFGDDQGGTYFGVFDHEKNPQPEE